MTSAVRELLSRVRNYLRELAHSTPGSDDQRLGLLKDINDALGEEKFERIVHLRGAFDRRDPNPRENYGIHGMDLLFVLKGPKGAVQFLVYTSMHLPHVAKELFEYGKSSMHNPFVATGADIGRHSPRPMYDDEEPISTEGSCPYVDGECCYYDGSSLAADAFMPKFLAEGSDAVWPMLMERYRDYFGECT